MGNYGRFSDYQGRIGLLGADRATQRRPVRPGATVLGGITRADGVG